MNNEITVQIGQGPVTLRKPKAGVRNKALMKAETGEGIKQTTFLVELIPYCVKTHPWGTTPVRQALDNLDVDDYDKLIDAISTMFGKTVDDAKNSEGQSGTKDTQSASDSETSQ